MKITIKRAQAILSRYEQLKDEAKRFADEKRQGMRKGPIRFDDELIEMEVNTACHCHPEYEWVPIGSLMELCEWLDKQSS
jgi:hypothetical protein